ncbi:MAG: hypothetical protein WCI02_02015 [Planctomycetota bacterium]
MSSNHVQKNPKSEIWLFFFFAFVLVIPGCDGLVPVSIMVTDEMKSPIPDALVLVLGDDLDDRFVPAVSIRVDKTGKGNSAFIGQRGGYMGLKVSADGYATLRKRVPCGKNGIDEVIILEKEKQDEP